MSKMNPAKQKCGIFSGGAAMLVVLAACSPPSSVATKAQAAPQVMATSKPTPTPVPAVTKTAAPTPAVSQSVDLRAKGKLVFEETAGGVGCASCHGPTGEGQSAPYVRGATEPQVRNALSGVPTMKFIALTEEEITAVVAHLEWLATQPSSHDDHH